MLLGFSRYQKIMARKNVARGRCAGRLTADIDVVVVVVVVEEEKAQKTVSD
jgi:hypothetical protein